MCFQRKNTPNIKYHVAMLRYQKQNNDIDFNYQISYSKKILLKLLQDSFGYYVGFTLKILLNVRIERYT